MTTYISLLRGINVGGKKLLKMEALRTMYENLDFKFVKTYVQSGNVIFATDETKIDKLEATIKEQIEIDFGYVVPVIVFTKEKMQKIIGLNPYLNNPEKEVSYMYVTFLASTPMKYDETFYAEKIEDGEEILIVDNAVYLYLPNGYANTKLNNNLFESKLKVEATTRNWKTTNALLNIAQE